MGRESDDHFDAEGGSYNNGQLMNPSRLSTCTSSWDFKEEEDDDSRKTMTEDVGKRSSVVVSNGSRGHEVTIMTGGQRSLVLDMAEVKACTELGFNLDLPLHLLPPINTTSRRSSSASTSPASSWPISSPGDDPRDIKARLRVWAQAVALASMSPSRRPTSYK